MGPGPAGHEGRAAQGRGEFQGRAQGGLSLILFSRVMMMMIVVIIIGVSSLMPPRPWCNEGPDMGILGSRAGTS